MRYLIIIVTILMISGCELYIPCDVIAHMITEALYSVGAEDLDALNKAADELRQLYPDLGPMIEDVLRDVQNGVDRARSEYATTVVCEAQ